MTIHRNLASPAQQSHEPHVTVVRTHELFESKTAPTRGLAHVGFENFPRDAPGRLDFEPLLLSAVGILYAGEGTRMHEHDNIDNVLLVRRGELRHRDSLGNDAVLRPDDAYLLAAGESIAHAETVEGAEDLHAVLIWIRPDRRGGPSQFYQCGKHQAITRDGWWLVASGRPHPAGRVLPLRRDAEILRGELAVEGTLEHHVGGSRRAYLVVLDGAVLVNGVRVEPGERGLVEGPGKLEFLSHSGAELILVDLATG